MYLLIGGLAALLAIGLLTARDGAAQGPRKEGRGEDATEKKTDRDAIEKSSREFVKAFEKGDAKAVAALWTEQGEYHHEGGPLVRGRAAIEEALAEFFKERPNNKVDVLIESIRFPSADLAIEEGLLRHSSASKDLPHSTLYSVTHVREGGRWKIAVSREWGAGQDRLEDLDWLVGKWKTAAGDQETQLSFNRDTERPYLQGQFTKKVKGKVVSSGTMRIGIDPERGQLRSWSFEDDGGNGQALWLRDGNRWVLDSIGVLNDGTETASVNILTRVNNNELTWRSIDRVMGDQELPDTVPLKLSRVTGGK